MVTLTAPGSAAELKLLKKAGLLVIALPQKPSAQSAPFFCREHKITVVCISIQEEFFSEDRHTHKKDMSLVTPVRRGGN